MSKNGIVVLENSCVNLIFGLVLLACSKKCVNVSLLCGHIRKMVYVAVINTRFYRGFRKE